MFPFVPPSPASLAAFQNANEARLEALAETGASLTKAAVLEARLDALETMLTARQDPEEAEEARRVLTWAAEVAKARQVADLERAIIGGVTPAVGRRRRPVPTDGTHSAEEWAKSLGLSDDDLGTPPPATVDPDGLGERA